MSLAMQLHLVMMSKFFKVGVDTFHTFWVMGYLQFSHNDDNNDDNNDENDDDLLITIAHFFLWNSHSNKMEADEDNLLLTKISGIFLRNLELFTGNHWQIYNQTVILMGTSKVKAKQKITISPSHDTSTYSCVGNDKINN